MQDACLDGLGDRRFDTLMDGRSGERSARYGIGRSLIATGSRLLANSLSAFDLFGWGEYLSQQHHACYSRKSEKDRRTWKSVFRGEAGSGYCDDDETRQEQTRR